jgi:CubicO group peptidase (beta-lactamase class C family)
MRNFIFILVVLSFQAQAQNKNKFTDSLDTFFQSVFKSNEPGGAVLLIKNGKLIYKKGFGVEDIKTKKPITAQTLFNVGSISKTFVAFGILRLAREKKLSLDDDLYKYFPDFKNPSIAKKIKLYHLLTHTSGLPDSRRVREDSVFYLTAKDAENFAPLKQTDSLHFEPGEKFEYSNPAFNGLALIIEKVTKIKWQEYIKKKIFIPSGMKTSTITDGPYPQSAVSHGYILNEKKEFTEDDYGEEPTFAAAGNGGVWSSVEELWKYEQAIQKNIFLKKDWITTSRTVYQFPDWKDKQSPFIGLCWFITKDGENNLIGHTGSQGGFISDYIWLPEKNIFYVLLCNTPKPIRSIRSKVFEFLKQNQ